MKEGNNPVVNSEMNTESPFNEFDDVKVAPFSPFALSPVARRNTLDSPSFISKLDIFSEQKANGFLEEFTNSKIFKPAIPTQSKVIQKILVKAAAKDEKEFFACFNYILDELDRSQKLKFPYSQKLEILRSALDALKIFDPSRPLGYENFFDKLFKFLNPRNSNEKLKFFQVGIEKEVIVSYSNLIKALKEIGISETWPPKALNNEDENLIIEVSGDLIKFVSKRRLELDKIINETRSTFGLATRLYKEEKEILSGLETKCKKIVDTRIRDRSSSMPAKMSVPFNNNQQNTTKLSAGLESLVLDPK